MDILHHAAIGFAGSMALASLDQPLAAAIFFGASILPDLDLIFILKGKRAYLKAHQTITHSLPIAAVLSFGIAYITMISFGIQQGIYAALSFFTSISIHVLLDASNTLGTRLMWPSKRRFKLDATFFIDALSWSLTGGALAALYLTEAAWPFAFYVILMITQILMRAHLSQKARDDSGYPIAIPDPLLPWAYTLTRIEPDGSTSLARWSLFSGLTHHSNTNVPSNLAKELALKSPAVLDMSTFARALVITQEDKTKDGQTRVILRDISMRRLGGRYGEITLLKNEEGEVVETIWI